MNRMQLRNLNDWLGNDAEPLNQVGKDVIRDVGQRVFGPVNRSHEFIVNVVRQLDDV